MQIINPALKKTLDSAGQLKDVNTAVVAGLRLYARFSRIQHWRPLPGPRGLRGVGGRDDHWILGRNARPRQPHWSVMRNVLHWVK